MQLGCVIRLADERRKGNVVHYGSSRCHRVTRSVMAAEVHALVLAFDFGYIIRDATEQLLDRRIEMEAFVDSRTLFNVVAKNGSTTERRLQIDIMASKKSYPPEELQKIGWIPGSSIFADGLAKKMILQLTATRKLMTKTNLDVNAVG